MAMEISFSVIRRLNRKFPIESSLFSQTPFVRLCPIRRPFVCVLPRGWGTRAGGRRAHVFDCACPSQTCPLRAVNESCWARKGAQFFFAIWGAFFRLKFLKNRVPDKKILQFDG